MKKNRINTSKSKIKSVLTNKRSIFNAWTTWLACLLTNCIQPFWKKIILQQNPLNMTNFTNLKPPSPCIDTISSHYLAIYLKYDSINMQLRCPDGLKCYIWPIVKYVFNPFKYRNVHSWDFKIKLSHFSTLAMKIYQV